MKKTFKLEHPKIKYPRLVEGVRHEINKYLKRERKKPRPEGVDYWDFNCKFGDTEEDATPVHVGDLSKRIDDVQARNLTSFYVEILAKKGRRTKSKG